MSQPPACVAESPKAQAFEMWSFWIMTIGMAVMVLALTGSSIVQVWLQRLPTSGALGFMATQDQMHFFYWSRLGGGRRLSAAALQAHPLNVGERAVMHAQTAAGAGLAEGAIARFSTAAGTASLPVSISDKVAPGVVWVESGYGATAPLAASRVEVRSA